MLTMTKTCAVEVCDRDAKARGWCWAHYMRWFNTGEPGTTPVGTLKNGRKYGSGYINAAGYCVLTRPGHPNANVKGEIFEHRFLMAEALERPLKDFENIHHKNGVRDDNRLENLELWITKQPFGQRAEDVIAWAKMIVETYEGA